MIKIKHVLQTVIFCIITLGIPAIITFLFPNECWTPRLGGLYVGICVFIQGYIQIHSGKFKRIYNDGIELKDKIMQWVYVLTIMGTLMWAFGDMFPKILWVPNGLCVAITNLP